MKPSRMKPSLSPAEFTLAYLAGAIGKQLNRNHFTIEGEHEESGRVWNSKDEDVQKRFEENLATKNKASTGIVPKQSERIGKVPKGPLDDSQDRTFAFKVYPKLLFPVGTKDGVKRAHIGNIEEYIASSLLTGEISPDGMKFSNCSAIFNPGTKQYDLFRKESEQANRYFYTDPVQMQEVLYKTIANAKAAGFTVDEAKLGQELTKQAEKLSKTYFTTLEKEVEKLASSSDKAADLAKAAIVAAGYSLKPQVACYVNGKKQVYDLENPIPTQYLNGVKQQSAGVAKVAEVIKENAELNRNLSIPVVNPIEEFLKDSALKVGGKDFIIWAIENHKKLPDDRGDEPLLYAIKEKRKIEGQDSIEWAIKNNQKIDTLEAGLWAVKNNKTINGRDAFEWLAINSGTIQGYLDNNRPAIPQAILMIAIEKEHKVEGKEALEWMLENKVGIKRVPPRELLVWARDAHHLIQGQDAYDWAIANDKITKIGDKDKFQLMVEEGHRIDKQHPIVWCINNNQQIEGKDALEWVKNNPSHLRVKEFYEHLVMVNDFETGPKFGGQDPVIWMIEQKLKPDGKDVIEYLAQYPTFTNNMHPVEWLQKKGFDYVEHAFKEGLQINGMHPVEWAQENKFKIKPEIELQYEVNRISTLGVDEQKAAIIEAAYEGKHDWLNALAEKKVDVYTPLAEEYIGLKGSKREEDLGPDVKDKRSKLETAYKGILAAQGATLLDKESKFGELVFSNTMAVMVRNFKYVSAGSKNRLSIKEELTKGLKSEAIMQKCTLPVIEKIYEIGQAIAKADREKPKGIHGVIQKCTSWLSSIFKQNIRSEAIKDAKAELIGDSASLKAAPLPHSDKVVQQRTNQHNHR